MSSFSLCSLLNRFSVELFGKSAGSVYPAVGFDEKSSAVRIYRHSGKKSGSQEFVHRCRQTVMLQLESIARPFDLCYRTKGGKAKLKGSLDDRVDSSLQH